MELIDKITKFSANHTYKTKEELLQFLINRQISKSIHTYIHTNIDKNNLPYIHTPHILPDTDFDNIAITRNGLSIIYYNRNFNKLVLCSRNKLGDNFTLSRIIEFEHGKKINQICTDSEKFLIVSEINNSEECRHIDILNLAGDNICNFSENNSKYFVNRYSNAFCRINDFECLIGRYKKGRLISESYKYNGTTYELCDNGSKYEDIDEVYPVKIAEMFNTYSNIGMDDTFVQGIVHINDNYYYLSIIAITLPRAMNPTLSKINCFVMKDIINNGPTKVFLPFDYENKYITSMFIDIIKISNGILYANDLYVYNTLYAIDLVATYNTKMYSITDKTTWKRRVKLPPFETYNFHGVAIDNSFILNEHVYRVSLCRPMISYDRDDVCNICIYKYNLTSFEKFGMIIQNTLRGKKFPFPKSIDIFDDKDIIEIIYNDWYQIHSYRIHKMTLLCI